MIYKTEQALSGSLKKGEQYPLYLLYGADESRKEWALTRIAKAAVPEGLADVDCTHLDGKKHSLNDVYDAVVTTPFLAGRRCVFWDDPEVDKYTAAEQKQLDEIFAQLGEGVVLILLVRGEEFTAKKSAKCKNLIEKADQLGAVVELGEFTAAEQQKAIISRLEKKGCTISPQDATYLVGRLPGDLLTLQNETDKLAAYANGGVVTKEAIESLVSATVEAEVFDLSKAILRMDYQGAMTTLHHLFYLREPEIAILYTLSYAFVDLYRAKAARHAGADVAQVVREFPYKGRDFRVKNAFRDSTRLSLGFLKKALEILAETDYLLKTARTDGQILLEETVNALFLAYQKEGER